MEQNCKDCVYVQNIEKRLSIVENDVKDIEKRLALLEQNTAAANEKFDMIFKLLDDIKNEINRIANKIEEIQAKPSNLFWSVLGAVVTALIIAGLQFIRK